MPERYLQQTFDQILAGDDDGSQHHKPDHDLLDATLRETTFVVVDLETTGGSPSDCGITEIGAVRVRGGTQLGEFATLVNPGHAVPPFITVLTGITQAMITPAPPLAEVLPAFLEFARGCVWVAHNAPYDVGFLKASCARHGYSWPRPRVLDTAALARRVLHHGEVPNRKLSTLARHFGARTPSHRALDDARATVDVLHALLGRLGGYQVGTLRDTMSFARPATATQRKQRHLAHGLPDKPGVYIFRAADDRPLYVGTSQSIATRVRSYFTASERRARMSQMLAAAVRVEAIACAHPLEAQVRELRIIAAHQPPYNRRSKFPERVHWLTLTAEAYPRLSLVRRVSQDQATYLGPFASRRAAEEVTAALLDALPLRPCTQRLSARSPSPACALAELAGCRAPCEHRISPQQYAATATDVLRSAVDGDPGPLVEALLARIADLSTRQRYEQAATARSRLAALLRALIRSQRLRSLTGIEHLVGARPNPGGGWQLAVIRHGRLAAAATSPPREHPGPTIDLICATAETVRPGPGPVSCATPAETERLLAWLEAPDARLVQISEGWSLPVGSAVRFAHLLTRVDQAVA